MKYRHRVAAPELTAPTTLSSAARSVDIQAAASWTRRHLVLGAIGVALGSTAGALLALPSTQPTTLSAPRDAEGAAIGRHAPSAGAAPTSAPPHAAVAESAAASPTTQPAPAALRDRQAMLVVQIKVVLMRFLAWSPAHAGARCPDPSVLGVPALDPWGQPLRIVCADQPPDQIAGVLSYGPDGKPGTHDDVVSWALGPEVTDLVRGPRWSATRRSPSPRPRPRSTSPALQPAATTPAGPAREPALAGPAREPAAAATQAPAPSQPAPRPPSGPGSGANPADGEGIPDRR